MATAPDTSIMAPDKGVFSSPWFMVAVAIVLGHAPLVVLHLRGLWQKEQYQYFPFVIGAVVWLLVSRWKETPENQNTLAAGKLWPRILLASSVLMLSVSVLLASAWLAMVSLNIGLAAIFIWIGWRRQIASLWGIWLLLWLMIPIPLGQDNRLIVFLQQLSSQLSSTLLDTLGIDHLMAGNVLTLPSKQLFVDEACSGIISVMSIVACAMIYAVWKNRTFLHLVLLTLFGIFWAVALNVVRICTIAVVHVHYEIDWSTGTPHEILGLALFALMFLALVSTDHLLGPLLSSIDSRHAEENWENNWLVRVWNHGLLHRKELLDNITDLDDPMAEASHSFSNAAPSMGLSRILAAGIPFLLLGAIQLFWLPSTDTAEASEAIERALTLQEEFAPAKIGPWAFESFEAVEREAYSDFGKYSRTYRYRHQEDARLVTVSLDFPYIGGWHDLCICYRNAGWTINERLVQTQGDKSQEVNWKYVESDLEDTAGGKAYVAFAGFDIQGEPASPPSALILHRSWFRLRRRLLHNLSPQLFQVQVFSQHDLSTNEVKKQEMRELLYHMGELFRGFVAKEAKPLVSN